MGGQGCIQFLVDQLTISQSIVPPTSLFAYPALCSFLRDWVNIGISCFSYTIQGGHKFKYLTTFVELKSSFSEKAQKNLKQSSTCFDKSADLLSKRQNNWKTFKFCGLLKIFEL